MTSITFVLTGTKGTFSIEMKKSSTPDNPILGYIFTIEKMPDSIYGSNEIALINKNHLRCVEIVNIDTVLSRLPSNIGEKTTINDWFEFVSAGYFDFKPMDGFISEDKKTCTIKDETEENKVKMMSIIWY
jgi:hypothetical protein